MFGKIKKVLGMGLVKLEINTTSQFVRTGGSLQGTVQVTAQGDQNIKDLIVKVNENESRTERNERRTYTNNLGQVRLGEQGLIKTGEVKQVPFDISYRGTTLLTANLQAQGGVLGALGTLGAIADQERTRYFLSVEAVVEGAGLHPATQIELPY